MRGFPGRRFPSVAAAVWAVALVAAGCSSNGEASPSPSPSSSPSASLAPPSAPASATPPASTPPAQATLRPEAPRVLVKGLEVPWGLGFLPGGDALVTERMSGRILRVAPSGEVSEAGTVAGVQARGEGGLLGLAVSPDFSSDHSIFVYYTADDGNRIVRLRVGDDGRIDGAAAAQKVLVKGIPAGNIHNGGGLAFGPDGMLYAGTGETGDRPLAQDKSSLAGKILRMTPDGKPAPDNPFGTLVWTYGHRNVQGLAWDSSGRMFATEFGRNTWDEINRIQPGKNYGWPVVEGKGGKGGYTDPLITWRTSEASPSGLAYAGGSLWAGALRGQRLWQIPVRADGSLGTPKALFQGKFGRIRGVAVAPDGRALWLTTSNRDGRGNPVADDDRIIVVPLV